jgi:predicted Zn finger-like uncharacterized protein
MSKKRPERTARRARERAARQLVRDKEKLAALVAGGSQARPLDVTSAAVIEIRVRALRCPQCDGAYAIVDHRSAGQGLRPVDVRCRVCGIARTLWFRIVSNEPN